MSRLDRFGDADLARIRGAVEVAEKGSGGEIVTYIVARADDYPETCWMGAAVGAVLGLGAALALVDTVRLWGASLWLWGLVPSVVGLVAGWCIVQWIPSVKRGVAGRRILERVTARAEQAFLEEEVFATADRTGILLFIALFERRVVILADEGILDSVAPETWNEVAEAVADDIANGPDPDAVVAGVVRMGELLVRHDVARRSDDRNELRDQPRVSES